MFLNNSIKACHRSLVILKDTCNLFVSDVIAILEAIFFQGLQLFNSPWIREEICIHFWPLKSACGKLAKLCQKLSLTCVVRWPFDIFSCKELSKIWNENVNRKSLKENYIQAWYLSVSLRSRHFRAGWNNYRFQTHQHSVTRISKTRLSSLYDREGKFSLQMELNWS